MRLLTAFAVAATLATAPAFAAGKEDECQMQANIVDRAAELRLEGKNVKRTKAIMQDNDPAVAEKYAAAVPHIVDWIFTLPRKQLKQEPGKAYFDACVKNN